MVVRRHSRQLWPICLLCPLWFGWSGAAVAQVLPDPIGNHDVLVVVARYPNSDPPRATAREWKNVFNRHVNAFYRDASGFGSTGGRGNQTSFTFHTPDEFGLPEVFELTTKYDAPPAFLGEGKTAVEDPRTLLSEGLEVLYGIEKANPEILENPALRRVVIVVNRPKRGQAFPAMPFVTQKAQVITLAICLQSVPADVTVQGTNVLVPGDDGRNLIEPLLVSTVCHELGHMIGLPDTYKERVSRGGPPGPEFNEHWCEMARDCRQNFSGFCRQMTGWIGPARMRVFTPPATGERVEVDISLFAPMTGVANQKELLFFPTTEDLRTFSPTMTGILRNLSDALSVTPPPFVGFLVEGRMKLNRDRTLDTDPDTGLKFKVYEDKDSNKELPQGLPKAYNEGVLISFTKPWLPGLRLPPFHPVEVRPNRERTDAFILQDAAFGVGETFSDDARGLKIEVRNRVGKNGFGLHVTWAPPPLPDVEAADIWLDNPSNGFGTFFTDFMGRDTGPPKFFGDPVFLPLNLRWEGSPIPLPKLEVSKVDHRIHVRIRNKGRAPLAMPKARLVILEPQIPAFGMLAPGPDFLTRLGEVILRLNPVRVFELGQADAPWTAPGAGGNAFPLAPRAAADARVTFQPGGPFLAVLLVDPARASDAASTAEPVEYWTSNVYWELFDFFQLAPGSPYPAFEDLLPLTNIDRIGTVITVTASGVPVTPGSLPSNRRWSGKLSPPSALLDIGKKDTFTLRLTPPDPGDAKPPQFLSIQLTGWMNYVDSMVPIGQVQVPVALSFGTRVAGTVNEKGNLTGRLEVRQLNGTYRKAPAGLPLLVTVSGADGTGSRFTPGERPHTAITNAQGGFTQDLTGGAALTKGGRYAVVMQFGGSAEYKGSHAMVEFPGPR
ncbi:MAG: hypothetical protein HYZ53_18815 [Planctomycetes bacterium]|nr:hypothetical protein [Planctomycetota bacterium]